MTAPTRALADFVASTRRAEGLCATIRSLEPLPDVATLAGLRAA